MMEFFRKMQNSWFAKSILILTGLSFVSLFGVAGYMGSAGKNRPVIKVDDYHVTQGEISHQFDQELQLAKNLFGDNVDINDNIRNSMLHGIVQKELLNTIIKKTADDQNVSIGDDLVRKVIFSQADFMDANGNFSREKLNRILAASGWTEQKYVDTIKLDITKQILVQNPIDNVNVPKVLSDNLTKAAKQKKVFKYIKIDPDEVKIDRKISQDEIEQYYQDFNAEFIEPEQRDVDFILLSPADIANNIQLSDEEIEAYYQENLSHFEVPETREILQMSFDNQEAADKAAQELKDGKDFYAVAKDVAGQSKEDTQLGYASKDMLIADMADAVFGLNKGEYAGPVKSEMGWHIMKVINIKSGSKTSLAQARKQITEDLKKEKSYDEAYNISSNIEDQIGAGQSLEDIAKGMNVRIYSAKGLTEDGKVRVQPQKYANLVPTTDFVDTAFSYNSGELSQVVETDDGFMVMRVVKVVDAHPKDIADVRGEIEKLWEANEKTAISQEIVNDVMHDLENGDRLEDVASRFQLAHHTTQPLTRSEKFEGLAPQYMYELFQEPKNSAKLIDNKGVQIIAVNTQIIPDNNISENDINNVKRSTRLDLSQDLAKTLVDDYGSDYDVRVKYRLLGLED